ncbi:hypothetical protein ABEB36_011525 [Hypothenemus hampei]|uniref:Uncharacterized protein n=1 Tax=Hypothenemus hampei TaxID=57062 RepID=A0ABD1EG36_HYPHA
MLKLKKKFKKVEYPHFFFNYYLGRLLFIKIENRTSPNCTITKDFFPRLASLTVQWDVAGRGYETFCHIYIPGEPKSWLALIIFVVYKLKKLKFGGKLYENRVD